MLERARSDAEPRDDPATSAEARAPVDTVELMGVQLHRITAAACVARVVAALNVGQGGWIVTPNLDHLRRLQHDAEFRDLCGQADLRVADGMPLVWASVVRGDPLPERVAGSDLIYSLSEALAADRRRAFFLGGDPGTAEAAAAALAARYPGLHVAGAHGPAPGFEKDAATVAALRAAVRDARPDLVFVALGSPKQEQWIARLRTEAPAAWWIGVGISFSFVCGDVKRAPAWVQRFGLEWAHRLVQEPGRLAHRYLFVGIPFATRLFGHALIARVRR
ncbi:MAG: WecB/TagA/CpsF family glycosyltransferase [Planctomycetota bacterium]